MVLRGRALQFCSPPAFLRKPGMSTRLLLLFSLVAGISSGAQLISSSSIGGGTGNISAIDNNPTLSSVVSTERANVEPDRTFIARSSAGFGHLHSFSQTIWDNAVVAANVPALSQTSYAIAEARELLFPSINEAVLAIQLDASGWFSVNGGNSANNFALMSARLSVEGATLQVTQPGRRTLLVPYSITPGGSLSVSMYLLTQTYCEFTGPLTYAPFCRMTADFSHTVRAGGAQLLDPNTLTPITGATLLSESGFDYTAPIPPSAVPEPASLSLLAAGALFLVWRQRA